MFRAPVFPGMITMILVFGLLMCVLANPRSSPQSDTEQGLTLRGVGSAKGREAPLLPREAVTIRLLLFMPLSLSGEASQHRANPLAMQELSRSHPLKAHICKDSLACHCDD